MENKDLGLVEVAKDNKMLNQFGVITNGWICTGCGVWVAYNDAHICPNALSGSIPAFGPEEPPEVRDIEAHQKLDEILKLLKRLT